MLFNLEKVVILRRLCWSWIPSSNCETLFGVSRPTSFDKKGSLTVKWSTYGTLNAAIFVSLTTKQISFGTFILPVGAINIILIIVYNEAVYLVKGGIEEKSFELGGKSYPVH